jgi:hypothetical protein
LRGLFQRSTSSSWRWLVHVCGFERGLRSDFPQSRRTLLNPVLIVEALSDSTEAYHRGGKFESYQTIESLQDYLLISSTHMHADLFVKQADGRWLLNPASNPEDVIELASCACRFDTGRPLRKGSIARAGDEESNSRSR